MLWPIGIPTYGGPIPESLTSRNLRPIESIVSSTPSKILSEIYNSGKKKFGIKLASLQYHFASRAVLIQALIGQASDYYQSRINELFELDFGVVPQQKLEQAIRSMLDDHKSQEESHFFSQLMAMTIEEPAAQELIDDFYQRLWTTGCDLLLELNPSLDEDERLNRSAHLVSLVEGCGFFISSPRLCGKLPDS